MASYTGPHVALFLPSLEGGGAERVMVNIAAGFVGRGFRTDMVLASAKGPHISLVPHDVRIIDLKCERIFRSLGPLWSYLRRERPAVLLAALNHANVVAMTTTRLPGVKTRTIMSIHNHLTKELEADRNIRDRTVQLMMKHVHRWSDGIVAVSQGVADDFARAASIPRGRIRVIYNPVITPSLLQDAAAEPSHPWFSDTSRPLVVGVGRLTRQKSFSSLVDAFALMKRDHESARLVILGEGPERAAIEASVRQHGLQQSVALPGFVENPYACIARASVLALSSEWEGLPTVLIESLAVGTPVVATDCPSGPREILQDGAFGTLVPVGDTAAFADALSRCLRTGRIALPPAALRPFMADAVLDEYQEVCALR